MYTFLSGEDGDMNITQAVLYITVPIVLKYFLVYRYDILLRPKKPDDNNGKRSPDKRREPTAKKTFS